MPTLLPFWFAFRTDLDTPLVHFACDSWVDAGKPDAFGHAGVGGSLTPSVTAARARDRRSTAA